MICLTKLRMVVMEDRNRTKCEVWSRVVGYLRPTSNWNEGKISEFNDRVMFNVNDEDEDYKDDEKEEE